MVELKELQKQIYQNKIAHNFNVTDVPLEFCLLQGEMSEAFQVYRKKKSDLGEELADVAIYLLGLSEIIGIDLEKEILQKMEKSSKHVYKEINDIQVRISDIEEI